MHAFARRARRFLRGGERSRAEIEEFLRANDFPRASIWGFSHWLDLVRVPPSGTWEQRRAHTFALAEEWVGPLAASEEAGIELLVRRYLGGFGPASKNDLSSWCKVPLAKLDPVLERTPLRRFRDEQGKELLDLPRAPLPDPETPAPVRFLPTWDAVLLVHARRTGILPEEYRPRVFSTKTPHSVGTFLVDGAVAGTWRYDSGRVDDERVQAPRRGHSSGGPRGSRPRLAASLHRLAPVFQFHMRQQHERSRARSRGR